MRRSRSFPQLWRSSISLSVLSSVVLSEAATHRHLRPGDLLGLAHLGLSEDGQQDDPSFGADEVADPPAFASQVEAQLAELALELAGVGLGEQDTLFLQQVDVEGHVTEFLV